MKKIIVIEDDKVLREALTALLRENGYEVCRIVKFEGKSRFSSFRHYFARHKRTGNFKKFTEDF